jgi:short-subunit dehydrogenase
VSGEAIVNVQIRSVVVTGASAGVGRAVAVRLAGEGVIVGLMARDALALEDVAREVEARGGQATILACDVADAGAVLAAGRRAAEAAGGIDVWVNAAMATVYGTLDQVTPEEFRRVTEVTYLGAVHGTMAAIEAMRARDRGVIVQIGSGLAYRGIPLQAAYCGAKHAIRGFTGALRAELLAAKSRIAITEVHLPAVNTPQFQWARTHRAAAPRPAGPVYQPEAIAEAVAAAVERPAREYWLGRQGPLMILGNQVVPGMLDRMMVGAIEAQSSAEPVAPDRRDNLMAPVAGLHRTRGRFSDEAADRVPSFDARLVRSAAMGLGLGGAFVLGVVFTLFFG